MKVRYTSGNGQLVFDIEAETAKALFSQLGAIQELFEAETKCGMCGSADIRFSARVVEEFDFYELACRDCHAQFRFGQKKKGGDLFPKRKDDDGVALPNGGWSRWEPQSSSAPVPPAEHPPSFGKPVPVTAQAGTPEGMQASFDRLGIIFNCHAPTRLGSALDLIRDQMHAAAGDSGTKRFDKVYRAYENSTGKGTTAAAKCLLRDLMAALEELKQEIHVP
jgi:hypothetical protein